MSLTINILTINILAYFSDLMINGLSLSKACKQVNVMRYLKSKIDTKSLEKIYIGFIRPIL